MRLTNLDAYRQIKDSGILSRRRLEVYNILFQYGPMTGGELSEMLPKKLSRTIGSNVHARLAELKQMGCVDETGTSICKISGMEVIKWAVNFKMPRKFKRKSLREIWALLDLANKIVMCVETKPFPGGIRFREVRKK